MKKEKKRKLITLMNLFHWKGQADKNYLDKRIYFERVQREIYNEQFHKRLSFFSI